jgi:DNA (cytosine-5)-methyltransferase 1
VFRILDLFCGAGGASHGYWLAGFEVVGVDIAKQPNYPFEGLQADALDVLWDIAHEKSPLGDFDAIHASPPCQHFTRYGNSVKDIKDRYEDLLAPTRGLLRETGLPYVIENVEGAPLIAPVILCGSMFDGEGTNDLKRHRLFETNWPLTPPTQCNHFWNERKYPGGAWKRMNKKDPTIRPTSPIRFTVEIGRWGIPLETQKWAMGIGWGVNVRELSEAIPPAYTEHVGKQLMAHLSNSMDLSHVSSEDTGHS